MAFLSLFNKMLPMHAICFFMKCTLQFMHPSHLRPKQMLPIPLIRAESTLVLERGNKSSLFKRSSSKEIPKTNPETKQSNWQMQGGGARKVSAVILSHNFPIGTSPSKQCLFLPSETIQDNVLVISRL